MQLDKRAISDAFTSMLRADYISLNNTEKLKLLGKYYVDYLNVLSKILSQTDQLIVGRRGTGKTTLLYRTLLECMRSWDAKSESNCLASPRTLGIYIDLSKCQSLSESDSDNFTDFEHIFVSELCDALIAEIERSWPEVTREQGFFSKLFKSVEMRRIQDTKTSLQKLATILRSGIPRLIDLSQPIEARKRIEGKESRESKLSANASASDLSSSFSFGETNQVTKEQEESGSYQVTYRLTIADILRVIGELREAAEIPYVILLVDEFSALSEKLQRRFTTLLRKILGNHSGLLVKLCAITDNYTLGSSIILQRDLFEVSLDLDAFVERSGSLSTAMTELEVQVEKIVEERIAAYYPDSGVEQIFEDSKDAWSQLSRSAMGVPRTIGIVLREAWHRASSSNRRIRKTDIEYGIKYASKAYLNQLLGSARDGTAIPQFNIDIWDAMLNRAMKERSISSVPASHFLILPKNEVKLRYLNMFFIVHLLSKGRTTKKEKYSRSLYCFDYGICLENNLGFANDRDSIRQQRFAYDEVLSDFDRFFAQAQEVNYICPKCNAVYSEKDLNVGNVKLNFCPVDKTDLQRQDYDVLKSQYTEEEIKIIGTIRSSTLEDKLIARQIADDVGCNVQKVAKFGEKLDKETIIARARVEDNEIRGRNIYFNPNSNR